VGDDKQFETIELAGGCISSNLACQKYASDEPCVDGSMGRYVDAPTTRLQLRVKENLSLSDRNVFHQVPTGQTISPAFEQVADPTCL